jgi:peptide deformylase
MGGNFVEFCFIGDERLKKHSIDVDINNKEENQELVNNLINVVKATNSAGLSAVQIGVLSRVFVTNIGTKIKVFINPEFLFKSQDEVTLEEEGCLSIPNVFAKVFRSANITIKYYDLDGNNYIETFESNMSRTIQHEMDHLDGILFIDRLSPARRSVIRKNLDLARKNRQKFIDHFNNVILWRIHRIETENKQT